MTEPISLGLAAIFGLQSGAVAAHRYYRSQREQYRRERELLERQIEHERQERRHLEDQLWSAARGRHDDGRR